MGRIATIAKIAKSGRIAKANSANTGTAKRVCRYRAGVL
jgi:hypothetical protein